MEWREAPSQKQLSEEDMLFLFHLARKLARQYPDRIVHYVRCDIESMPVTENNRPFTAEKPTKTIYYAKTLYIAKMG